MSVSCQDRICKLVECTNTGDLPSYLGAYNLQGGLFFTNTAISVPIPGGFYIVPPGTITIPTQSPNQPNASTVSYQGCLNTVSATIPAGSSQEQISVIVNGLMNQVAAQLAICNAPPNPHPPGKKFLNTNGSASCPEGKSMNLVGSLPPTVTMVGDTLFASAGTFSSSISVDDANSKAITFLNSLIGTVVECGYWNTEQVFTCPNGSTQTVPAHTYFSTDSQDDADEQALEAAAAACPAGNDCPDFSQFFWPSFGTDFNVAPFTGTITPQDAIGSTLSIREQAPIGTVGTKTCGYEDLNDDTTGINYAGTGFVGVLRIRTSGVTDSRITYAIIFYLFLKDAGTNVTNVLQVNQSFPIGTLPTDGDYLFSVDNLTTNPSNFYRGYYLHGQLGFHITTTVPTDFTTLFQLDCLSTPQIWTALAWNPTIVTSGSAVGTFTPNGGGTGAVVRTHAKSTGDGTPDQDVSTDNFTTNPLGSTLTYNGPAINCQAAIKVEQSSGAAGPWGYGGSVVITDETTSTVLYTSPDWSVSGPAFIYANFTIPSTGGTDHVISVKVSNTISSAPVGGDTEQWVDVIFGTIT